MNLNLNLNLNSKLSSNPFSRLICCWREIKKNPGPGRQRWDGDRNALGTVVYNQYGRYETTSKATGKRTTAAGTGKPIDLKEGMKVQWSERAQAFTAAADRDTFHHGGARSPSALALQDRSEKGVLEADVYGKHVLQGDPVYHSKPKPVDEHYMQEVQETILQENLLRERNMRGKKYKAEAKDLNQQPVGVNGVSSKYAIENKGITSGYDLSHCALCSNYCSYLYASFR